MADITENKATVITELGNQQVHEESNLEQGFISNGQTAGDINYKQQVSDPLFIYQRNG